jgi:hypothetical protein
MLGKQGVIRLSPDEQVTAGLGLSEGIEDGLSVLLGGWTPVWAATSCGAIEHFPVLDEVECLSIFADADGPGLEAADACCTRWLEAGHESIVLPPPQEGRP